MAYFSGVSVSKLALCCHYLHIKLLASPQFTVAQNFEVVDLLSLEVIKLDEISLGVRASLPYFKTLGHGLQAYRENINILG